jgi:ribonuclease/clavin/mitogillin
MLSCLGDLILGETSAKFEDLSDYMSSLQKVLKLNVNTIYPGHGPMVKDGVARINQYIEHRSKRNEQILQTLRGSPDKYFEIAEIVRIIYQVNFESISFCSMKILNLKWSLKK